MIEKLRFLDMDTSQKKLWTESHLILHFKRIPSPKTINKYEYILTQKQINSTTVYRCNSRMVYFKYKQSFCVADIKDVNINKH